MLNYLSLMITWKKVFFEMFAGAFMNQSLNGRYS